MNEVLVARDDLESWQMNAESVAETLDLIRAAVSTAKQDMTKEVKGTCHVLALLMDYMADELMVAKNRREETA